MSELPKNWIQTTLGEVCTQPQYGYTTSGAKTGTLHLLRTTDITSGKIDWNSVPYCEANPADEEKYLLKDGDIVISRAGSVGVSYLIKNPERAVFASYLIRFRPFINTEFFKYFLNSPDYWQQISENRLGIAVPNVNASKLQTIPIPVPPTNEQKRIVARLEELFSELDSGIESLKTAREQLKVYRQAVLKHAFEGKLTAPWREKNKYKLESADQLLKIIPAHRHKNLDTPTELEIEKFPVLPNGWKYARLGYFIDSISAGKSFKCDEREPTKDEIGVAKVSAVTWGEYDEHESKTCIDSAKVHPEYFIQSGDFLFSRANTIELVGACVIARTVTKRIMLSDKTLRIKFGDLDPYYFLHYLRSQMARNEIMERSTGNQDSMRNIGQDRIRNIIVPVCSAQEAEIIKQHIEETFSVIENLQLVIDAELQKSEALRQSILKKAFSGQLVAQNPADEPASVLLERIRSKKATPKPTAKKPKEKRRAA